MESLLSTLGALVVTGGGAAAIALAVVRFAGARWIEGEFAKQLERFRHEQQKELEQIRYGINSLFDRAVRLHQAEFEVVPEAWSLMRTAHREASSVLSLGRIFPDWNQMGATQFEETLEASRLKKWQKEEMRAASNKMNYYKDAIFWHELSDAKIAHKALRDYLTQKGVFMSPELEAKFTELCELIFCALVEREMSGPTRFDYYQEEDNKKLRTIGVTLIEDIRSIVRGVLWDSKSVVR